MCTKVKDLVEWLTNPDDDVDIEVSIQELPVKFATGGGEFLEVLSVYDCKDEKGNTIICIDVG